MDSIRRYALLLTISFFVMAGDCRSGGLFYGFSEAYAMSEVIVEKDRGGGEYVVDQGGRVIIRLPENPTTGYHWKVDSFDSTILAPPDSEFSTAGTGKGAGGMRTLIFKVRSPGLTPLRLIKKRSWEPKQKAIDRFDITVRVLGAK